MVEQKFEAKKLEMIFFIFVFGKTMVTEKRSKVKNQRNKTFNRIWWHEFVPFCSTSHKKNTGNSTRPYRIFHRTHCPLDHCWLFEPIVQRNLYRNLNQ